MRKSELERESEQRELKKKQQHKNMNNEHNVHFKWFYIRTNIIVVYAMERAI